MDWTVTYCGACDVDGITLDDEEARYSCCIASQRQLPCPCLRFSSDGRMTLAPSISSVGATRVRLVAVHGLGSGSGRLLSPCSRCMPAQPRVQLPFRRRNAVLLDVNTYLEPHIFLQKPLLISRPHRARWVPPVCCRLSSVSWDDEIILASRQIRKVRHFVLEPYCLGVVGHLSPPTFLLAWASR